MILRFWQIAKNAVDVFHILKGVFSMNIFKKAGAVVVGLVVSASSFAALPVSVATDVTTTTTDALTLGGLVLGLVVGIAVFKHLRSAK